MTKWQFSRIDLHTLIWESKQTRGSQHLISQCLYTRPLILAYPKSECKGGYLIGEVVSIHGYGSGDHATELVRHPASSRYALRCNNKEYSCYNSISRLVVLPAHILGISPPYTNKAIYTLLVHDIHS